MKRSYWLWILGIAGIVGTYWWFHRPQSLQDYSRDMVDCFVRKDSGCLADQEWGEERKRYGVTKEQVIRLLDTYYFPRLKTASRVTPDLEIQQDKVDTRIPVEMKNGRKYNFYLGASETEDGKRLPSLLMSAIISVGLDKYYTPGVGISNTIAKLQAWKRQAIEDRAQLESLGFKGFCAGANDVFLTWDEYAKSLDVRIERARAALNKPKPGR